MLTTFPFPPPNPESARTFINVKAPKGEMTTQAKLTLKAWGKLRKTPEYLCQAVQIFDALRLGDGARFWALVGEYLPGKVVGAILAAAPGGQIPAAPAIAIVQPPPTAPVQGRLLLIEPQGQQDAGKLGDMLIDSFGGIEF